MRFFLAWAIILIAAVGFGQGAAKQTSKAVEQTTASRLDEIWSYVDNRLITQIDFWFSDGEFPRAIALVELQHAENPKDYDTLTNLGWMLSNVERYDDTEKLYKTYWEENPNDPESSYPLGEFYTIRRNFHRTIEIFEPALKNNPHANAYRLLAKAYEREKKYNDAIRVWTLQLKRWPDDGPAKANIERVKAKIASGK